MTKKLLTVLFCFLACAGIFTSSADYWLVTLNQRGRSQLRFRIHSLFSSSDISIAPQTCPQTAGGVDVVMTGSADRFDGLLTTVFSATQNKCPSSAYRFHIFTEDLTNEQKQTLKKLESPSVSIDFRAYASKKAPCAARLLKNKAPTFLFADSAPDLNQVLYLGDDTLVMRDLTAFNQIDLSVLKDFYIAAVRRHEPEKPASRGFPWREKDQPPFEYPYFNADVMSLNLDALRAENIDAKACAFSEKHGIPLEEQEEIWNGISFGKAIFLPYADNAMTDAFSFENWENANMMTTLHNQYYSDMTPLPDFPEKVYETAVVIHYTSNEGKLAKPLNALRESYAEKARELIAP